MDVTENSISSTQMEPASNAAMVTSQTPAEPDVLRETSFWRRNHAKEIERSPTKMESVRHACHTPELRRRTVSASQTNVTTTRSSHGSELALTAKMEPNQMPTKEAALDQHQ
jgi:hypothetical protein